MGGGELRECGVVDYIFLGLISTELEKHITTTCKKAAENIYCSEERSADRKDLLAQWKDIIKLIRIQNIGIHRISSSISERRKVEWSKDFNLTSVKKERLLAKKEAKRKAADLSDDDDSDDDSTPSKTPTPKQKPQSNPPVKPLPNATILKPCKCIKCHFQERIWSESLCGFSKKIKNDCKECQSCAKLSTALRKSTSIAKTLLEYRNDDNKITVFKNTLDKIKSLSQPCRMIKHLHNLLHSTNSEINFNLLHKSKGTVTDNAKQVMRILGHIFHMNTMSICSNAFLETFLPEGDNHPIIPHSTSRDPNSIWNTLEKAIKTWELALNGKPPSIKKSRKRNSPCVPKTTTISTISPKRTKRLFVKIEDPNEGNINPSKNKAVINLIEDKKKTKMRLQRSKLKYDPSREISEHKNLLTDQGADIILDIFIRHSCTNHNTFIAYAIATGILSLGPCNDWIELEDYSVTMEQETKQMDSTSFLHS